MVSTVSLMSITVSIVTLKSITVSIYLAKTEMLVFALLYVLLQVCRLKRFVGDATVKIKIKFF